MSDSDSDSELAQSVYDPEDNLNCYGSPVSNVEPERTESDETVASISNAAAAVESIESLRTQVKFACMYSISGFFLPKMYITFNNLLFL